VDLIEVHGRVELAGSDHGAHKALGAVAIQRGDLHHEVQPTGPHHARMDLIHVVVVMTSITSVPLAVMPSKDSSSSETSCGLLVEDWVSMSSTNTTAGW